MHVLPATKLGAQRSAVPRAGRDGGLAAREMFCRNVYLRTRVSMPRTGWVIGLGVNRACSRSGRRWPSARVLAVEAQQSFEPEIRHLVKHNGVADRIRVQVPWSATSSGWVRASAWWPTTSAGPPRRIAPERPAGVSAPQLMSAYQIGRIGLLKVDIEGGEFAVFGAEEDLSWLDRVDQMVMDVHPEWGDAAELVGRLGRRGFIVSLRDNEGTRVSATSSRLKYAYLSRS